MNQHVLQLDLHGTPLDFITLRDAALAYATDSVAWTIGEDEPLYVMRGGTNARTGRQSMMEIAPIIAMRGHSRVNLHDICPSLTNAKLFRRDRVCCYCGDKPARGLTRDHVVPTSRGGLNTWENVVASCLGCNARKGAKLVEEAGMSMLYLPYRPSLFEDLLLRGRTIRADVHQWLATRLPKGSRLM